jgi:hypothetical protein
LAIAHWDGEDGGMELVEVKPRLGHISRMKHVRFPVAPPYGGLLWFPFDPSERSGFTRLLQKHNLGSTVSLYKDTSPLCSRPLDQAQILLFQLLEAVNRHLNMKLSSLVTTAALFSQSAVAHYKFPSLIVNGTSTSEYKYVRFNTNNINPLLDLNSIDLRCNEGGLASGAQTETAVVQAGSTVPCAHSLSRLSSDSLTGRLYAKQLHRPHRSLVGLHG